MVSLGARRPYASVAVPARAAAKLLASWHLMCLPLAAPPVAPGCPLLALALLLAAAARVYAPSALRWRQQAQHVHVAAPAVLLVVVAAVLCIGSPTHPLPACCSARATRARRPRARALAVRARAVHTTTVGCARREDRRPARIHYGRGRGGQPQCPSGQVGRVGSAK